MLVLNYWHGRLTYDRAANLRRRLKMHPHSGGGWDQSCTFELENHRLYIKMGLQKQAGDRLSIFCIQIE